MLCGFSSFIKSVHYYSYFQINDTHTLFDMSNAVHQAPIIYEANYLIAAVFEDGCLPGFI